MEKKISFKDLDGWLRFIVIINWLSIGIVGVGFLAGFFYGLVEY